MALSKKNRLKKKKDFERVFRKGRAVNGSFLFIKFRPNSIGVPRIAFVISIKVSKKAVIRNKIRRILSEAARLSFKEIPSYDIIVVANNKIVGVQKNEIRQDLIGTLKKIK